MSRMEKVLRTVGVMIGVYTISVVVMFDVISSLSFAASDYTLFGPPIAAIIAAMVVGLKMHKSGWLGLVPILPGDLFYEFSLRQKWWVTGLFAPPAGLIGFGTLYMSDVVPPVVWEDGLFTAAALPMSVIGHTIMVFAAFELADRMSVEKGLNIETFARTFAQMRPSDRDVLKAVHQQPGAVIKAKVDSHNDMFWDRLARFGFLILYDKDDLMEKGMTADNETVWEVTDTGTKVLPKLFERTEKIASYH